VSGQASSIRFKAVVTNISIVDTLWGEKVVRVDLTEEREAPSALVMPAEQSELAREIVPIVTQILRAMPFPGTSGKARLPRLSLYLTEEEWERLADKPTIGDLVEVEVVGSTIRVRRG